MLQIFGVLLNKSVVEIAHEMGKKHGFSCFFLLFELSVLSSSSNSSVNNCLVLIINDEFRGQERGGAGEERQMSSVLDLKASKFHRLIVFFERAAGKKLPNWANKK